MITSIFVAKKSTQVLQAVERVQVVFGAGITGDRNFKKSQWPGQNITFIEQESIDQFNTTYNQTITASATRRNVITTGVDLNALVGKEFTIGTATFKGVELCVPCSKLGELLQNDSIAKATVVKAFLDSGGLRADVIDSGVIAVGMPVKRV